MKSIPRVLWLVPPIILLIATARLPYGYYTFTRIVTCAVAALIAFVGFQDRPAMPMWSVLFALIAVLFNPFVPIHLTRPIWFYLDLITAAIFMAHLLFARLGLSTLMRAKRANQSDVGPAQ
jgi:hypothetical protein